MIEWKEEHEFWFKKVRAASIRFEAAIETNDYEKMDVAAQQFRLYAHRMDKVVPESVKEEWRKRDEAERLAALNE